MQRSLSASPVFADPFGRGAGDWIWRSQASQSREAGKTLLWVRYAAEGTLGVVVPLNIVTSAN